MGDRSGTPHPSELRQRLWSALGGALIGATAVCGVMIAFTYRWLVFDDLPRISAIVALLGIVAFMFAASRFGAAIALLGEQRSVRAQQAVAADRPKTGAG